MFCVSIMVLFPLVFWIWFWMVEVDLIQKEMEKIKERHKILEVENAIEWKEHIRNRT